VGGGRDYGFVKKRSRKAEKQNESDKLLTGKKLQKEITVGKCSREGSFGVTWILQNRGQKTLSNFLKRAQKK